MSIIKENLKCTMCGVIIEPVRHNPGVIIYNGLDDPSSLVCDPCSKKKRKK